MSAGGEEALAVGEAREPERLGASRVDPLVELLEAREERLEPDAHRRREPRVLQPQRRHLQRRSQLVSHSIGRYQATWKREFKLPWRKAGPVKPSR